MNSKKLAVQLQWQMEQLILEKILKFVKRVRKGALYNHLIILYLWLFFIDYYFYR